MTCFWNFGNRHISEARKAENFKYDTDIPQGSLSRNRSNGSGKGHVTYLFNLGLSVFQEPVKLEDLNLASQ